MKSCYGMVLAIGGGFKNSKLEVDFLKNCVKIVTRVIIYIIVKVSQILRRQLFL